MIFYGGRLYYNCQRLAKKILSRIYQHRIPYYKNLKIDRLELQEEKRFIEYQTAVRDIMKGIARSMEDAVAAHCLALPATEPTQIMAGFGMLLNFTNMPWSKFKRYLIATPTFPSLTTVNNENI